MSLNARERARTSEELRANLRLAGASQEEVRAGLDFTTQQLADTFDLRETCRPQDVWRLRDHLERLVRQRGETPAAYSVLTEQARSAAQGWFPGI